MTEQLVLLVTGVLALAAGSLFGYFARQSIARRRAGTIEQKLQKKVQEATEESEEILSVAKNRAKEVVETAKTEEEKRRHAFRGRALRRVGSHSRPRSSHPLHRSGADPAGYWPSSRPSSDARPDHPDARCGASTME